MFKIDKIFNLNVLTILIAICALGTSIWQGVVTRKHNRLSLAPYVTAAPILSDDKNIAISISNDGTGTAFIIKAELIAKGKSFDLTKNIWSEVYSHLNIRDDCHAESWFKVGSALKAGEMIELLSLTKSKLRSGCLIEFLKILEEDELDLSIVFKSIYGEQYSYKDRVGLTEEDINRIKEKLENQNRVRLD